jgi:hypothetical protein
MDIGVEVLFFDRTAKGKKLKILVIWRIFVIKIAENDILREVVVFDVARVGGDDSDLAVFVLALLLNGDDAGRDGVSVYQFFKVHKKEWSLIFLLLTPLYGRIRPSSNNMHLMVKGLIRRLASLWKSIFY